MSRSTTRVKSVCIRPDTEYPDENKFDSCLTTRGFKQDGLFNPLVNEQCWCLGARCPCLQDTIEHVVVLWLATLVQLHPVYWLVFTVCLSPPRCTGCDTSRWVRSVRALYGWFPEGHASTPVLWSCTAPPPRGRQMKLLDWWQVRSCIGGVAGQDAGTQTSLGWSKGVQE